MNPLTDQTSNKWDSQDGLMDLIESGIPAQEIEQKMRDGALVLPASTRSGFSSLKLDDLINWLKGFRKEAVIYQDEKIYLPLIELWAPPGGKASFTYEVSREDSLAAELSLFGAAGFGGASKRLISDSIEMRVDAGGRSLTIAVLLTVTRYRHKNDPKLSFDKTDIHGIDGNFDYKPVDLQPDHFIMGSQEIAENDLVPEDYSRVRYYRMSDTNKNAHDVYSPAVEENCEWSMDLSLPLLSNKLKVSVGTKRSKKFKTSFECPGGYDYAFFSRFGENLAVPYCVRLTP